VPFLDDGEQEVFKSGAGLLHLARKNRVTHRPSFKKARADQVAHFAASEESRSAAG
jgi:hypothetical protein